jgi:2-phospho-L-lactate guanylyltransferase
VSVWVLVPVKDLDRAKSRLGGVLDAPARAAFARSLVTHVLDVLGGCEELGGVMVATSSPEVAAMARERGAAVLPDTDVSSLAAIVDAALVDLAARGASGALVLMSDLPLLTAGDVRDLLRLMREAEVVAAPDHRGESTNALGLSPPDRLRTAFGTGASFERHLAAARAEGLRVAIHRSQGLGADVDEPEDLARLPARGDHP